MIGLFIVRIIVASNQTPTVKKTSSHKTETKQTVASTTIDATRDISSSIEEAKRVKEEKIAKEKAKNEVQEKGEVLVDFLQNLDLTSIKVDAVLVKYWSRTYK